MKTENVWVIVGVHGLYFGTWGTKVEAIKDHCKALGVTWRYCRKKGDRAIKAQITF